MPAYLVETYQTEPPAADVFAHARSSSGVRHVHSVFIREDELALHLFSGPSARAVRDALDRISFVYDRIVEASTGSCAARSEGA